MANKLFKVTVRETGSSWVRSYYTAARDMKHAGARVMKVARAYPIVRPKVLAVELVEHFLP